MKSIILPSSHIIFDYFPNLESENKSFTEFKNETKHKLKMIYTDSDRFVLQREIISTEHVNWRYPLMTPYFIKEEIKNKNVQISHNGYKVFSLQDIRKRHALLYFKDLFPYEIILIIGEKWAEL